MGSEPVVCSTIRIVAADLERGIDTMEAIEHAQARLTFDHPAGIVQQSDIGPTCSSIHLRSKTVDAEVQHTTTTDFAHERFFNVVSIWMVVSFENPHFLDSTQIAHVLGEQRGITN